MKAALSLFGCLLLSSVVFAQEVRVKTIVSGEFDVKGQVASKINRHLRTFKDVVVADTDPHLEVEIVVIKTMSEQPGHHLGYVLSVVVAEPLMDRECKALAALYSGGAKEMLDYYRRQSLFSSHYLYVVGPDNLDARCQAIVEVLDSQHIEGFRKARQKLLPPKAR